MCTVTKKQWTSARIFCVVRGVRCTCFFATLYTFSSLPAGIMYRSDEIFLALDSSILFLISFLEVTLFTSWTYDGNLPFWNVMNAPCIISNFVAIPSALYAFIVARTQKLPHNAAVWKLSLLFRHVFICCFHIDFRFFLCFLVGGVFFIGLKEILFCTFRMRKAMQAPLHVVHACFFIVCCLDLVSNGNGTFLYLFLVLFALPIYPMQLKQTVKEFCFVVAYCI